MQPNTLNHEFVNIIKEAGYVIKSVYDHRTSTFHDERNRVNIVVNILGHQNLHQVKADVIKGGWDKYFEVHHSPKAVRGKTTQIVWSPPLWTPIKMRRHLMKQGVPNLALDVHQDSEVDLIRAFLPSKYNGDVLKQRLIEIGWPANQMFARIESRLTEIQFDPMQATVRKIYYDGRSV